MSNLLGLICPRNKENVPFEHCITKCKDRCHPLPLIMALRNTRKTEENVYHVTEILNPPQVVYLQRNNEYYATFESLIWMTLGTAWHKIPEGQSGEIKLLGLSWAHRIEEGFEVKIGDNYLTGKADYYDAETATLWDYKTMKSYPIEKLKKNNWSDSTYKDQLNIYRVYGFPQAQNLKLEAIVKDWSTRIQKSKNIYPVETITVPIMPDEEVRSMTERLIKEHSDNQKDPSKVRLCKVPEETWYNKNPRGANYKVHLRCRDYCPVSKICPQYQKIQGGDMIDEIPF